MSGSTISAWPPMRHSRTRRNSPISTSRLPARWICVRTYDSGSDCLAVTIKDRGKWRQPVDDSIGADARFSLPGARDSPHACPRRRSKRFTPAQPERRSGDGGTLCCHSTADRLQLARRQPLGRRLKSLAPSWGPYRHSGVGCPPLVTQTANRVTCYGFVLARVAARKRQQRASFEIRCAQHLPQYHSASGFMFEYGGGEFLGAVREVPTEDHHVRP